MENTETLLRLPQVCARTALSRSQVYALVRNRSFPSPIKLSARCSAWPESQVRTWIQSRIAASEQNKEAA
ncbi:MAG: AlpA family transcriptional regulator [Rhodanobacter sp.]|nr:AlpA family transcriptional regulator [Rhodanobacter sp.]